LENWRTDLPKFDRVEHPILNVTINGGQPDYRPSSFFLSTDEGFPGVIATLQFPAEEKKGEAGDKVTVNMELGDEEYLLFTGEAYLVFSGPRHRSLALTDGYQKLCDTKTVCAYRKEQAKVILQDALDKAGITETSITCPPVLIHRFSTKEIPVEEVIKLLIKALEEHGEEGLRFFFDEKDVFHFGKDKDTGKNEGEVFEFETEKNIIEKRESFIKVLPVPIRHTQKVKVDGAEFVTRRTNLNVSGTRSWLKLWLREAE
jgi:hypothetical protein